MGSSTAFSERVGRYLEQPGLLVTDMDNSYLTLEPRDDTTMNDLVGHSITYRIAVGPHQGEKAFTLQTLATSACSESISRPAGAEAER